MVVYVGARGFLSMDVSLVLVTLRFQKAVADAVIVQSLVILLFGVRLTS